MKIYVTIIMVIFVVALGILVQKQRAETVAAFALDDCQEIHFYEAHAEKCDILIKGTVATTLSTKEYWLNEAVKNIEVK
jgi:hypothetical protein